MHRHVHCGFDFRYLLGRRCLCYFVFLWEKIKESMAVPEFIWFHKYKILQREL